VSRVGVLFNGIRTQGGGTHSERAYGRPKNSAQVPVPPDHNRNFATTIQNQDGFVKAMVNLDDECESQKPGRNCKLL
jgi:hypothetical protein